MTSLGVPTAGLCPSRAMLLNQDCGGSVSTSQLAGNRKSNGASAYHLEPDVSTKGSPQSRLVHAHRVCVVRILRTGGREQS